MKSKNQARAVLAATIACAGAHTGLQAQTPVLNPVVVTAARTPQSAKDVLADVLVISADEIQASGQKNLVDLLQSKRSVEITRNGGPGAAASVFIRGAANYQSVVLIDGVRAGSATLGGATWESLPLAQIDHIEIVYGPQSSLYGADAIGGVVQIFTRQGEGAARLNASAGIGSYGMRSVEGGVSGSSSDAHKFRYAIQGATERADGFSASKPGAGSFTYNADRDGYRRNSASANFGLSLAPGSDLTLSLLNSRIEAQFDAGAGFDDRTEQEAGSYALGFKQKWNDIWTTSFTLARSTDKGKTIASYGNSFIDTRQDQYGMQNDIAIGADVLQVVTERRVERVTSDTSALAKERSTNSLAASYNLRRDAHLFSLAARSDDSSQYGRNTTGSAEYGYRFAPGWRFSAAAGSSFRAPSFNELYYPGYGVDTNKPEQGRNVELGLHYEQGGASFAAVAYRNRLRDLLVYAPVCPVQASTHAFGCAYNVNQATLAGVSLSAGYTAGVLRLDGSLDLQNADDDTTGKRLARRARQHGSFAVAYAAGGLRTGVETVLSGERFDDAGNFNRMGGYGLVNLFASQQLSGGWSVFGRWNNVLDKNYELVRNYTTPGSNFFLGVRTSM